MTFTAKLIARRELTAEVFELEFQAPAGFTYAPGNFATVRVPQQKGGPLFRSYTFASAPNPQGSFKFLVKLFRGAGGRPGQGGGYLKALPLGATAEFLGPLGQGKFTAAYTSPRKLLLLGTGTGIAPFLALAQDFTERQAPRPLLLFLGVSYEQDIFYLKEFEALQCRNPNFAFRIALSRPPANYPGLAGRLPAVLAAEFPAGLAADFEAKVCGSRAVVQAIKARLRELGLAEERIEAAGFGET